MIVVLTYCAGAHPQLDSRATRTFAGTVADPMKAPIAKTRIWVHEADGERTFSTITDAEGRFSVKLPDGHYAVLFTASGFAPYCKVYWTEMDLEKNLEIQLRPDVEHLEHIPGLESR